MNEPTYCGILVKFKRPLSARQAIPYVDGIRLMRGVATVALTQADLGDDADEFQALLEHSEELRR